MAARCWWHEAPWFGRIADDEFRAVVAAYVAKYGVYTPDLPEREPALLQAWIQERATTPPVQTEQPGRPEAAA